MLLCGARPIISLSARPSASLFSRSFSRLAASRSLPMARTGLASPAQSVPRTSRLGVRMVSTQTTTPQMSWNEFFKLRKRRRVVGFVTSFFTASIASALAFDYFANLVIDFNQTFLGIEMQWIYLGGIAICGFLGWVVGPFVGSQLFNISIGSSRAAFTQMDNVFLRHIARNRPNPVRHNVNTNPLPDYYGEKIGSLHDYRQWLREGRLFEKKASKFL